MFLTLKYLNDRTHDHAVITMKIYCQFVNLVFKKFVTEKHFSFYNGTKLLTQDIQ